MPTPLLVFTTCRCNATTNTTCNCNTTTRYNPNNNHCNATCNGCNTTTSHDVDATCNHRNTSCKVLPFSDIPNQIGYIAKLNIPMSNCDMAYCLIPCTLKKEYSSGEVISLRCGDFNKGVEGGSFSNALIIDVNTGRKIHIKYFYTKGTLQMCNILNYEEACESTQLICTLLNAANDTAKHMLEDKHKTREAFKWLSNHSEGPKCETLLPTRVKNDKLFGDICVYKRVVGPSILWPTDIPEEYLSILQLFRELSSDLFNNGRDDAVPHFLLMQRMIAVLGLTIVNKQFDVNEVLCSSMVKRYDLGFVIDRYTLTNELEARGYDVSFDNMSNSSVIVHISSKLKFDPSKLQRKNDNSRETYIFNPGGVVEHHGCVDYMMEDTYNDLIAGTVFSLRDKIALS